MKKYLVVVLAAGITIQAADASHKAGSVTHIKTIAELDSHIGKGKPIALKIGNDNCEPCKQMAPVFAKVAPDHPDVIFLEMNVTGNANADTELKKRYKVEVHPALVSIDKDGKQKGKTEHGGILNPAEIDATIKVLKGELVWMDLPEGQTPPQGALQMSSSSQQQPQMQQQQPQMQQQQMMSGPQQGGMPQMKLRQAQPGEELYAMRGGKMVRVSASPTQPTPETSQAPKGKKFSAKQRHLQKKAPVKSAPAVKPQPIHPSTLPAQAPQAGQKRLYTQEEVNAILDNQKDTTPRTRATVRRYRNRSRR